MQNLSRAKGDGGYDIHVRPFWSHCDVCHIPYDFIGKLETSKEDTRAILDKMGIEQDPLGNGTVLNKSSHTLSTPESTVQLVRALPPETVRELLNVFEFDFEAFGYDSSVYL